MQKIICKEKPKMFFSFSKIKTYKKIKKENEYYLIDEDGEMISVKKITDPKEKIKINLSFVFLSVLVGIFFILFYFIITITQKNSFFCLDVIIPFIALVCSLFFIKIKHYKIKQIVLFFEFFLYFIVILTLNNFSLNNLVFINFDFTTLFFIGNIFLLFAIQRIKSDAECVFENENFYFLCNKLLKDEE